ncbi:PAS domain S-box protein [Caulobacter sp. RHG1]|uniref:PAS domain S-box protein n=1 Tax=Caulobacter sp. (strain RHG1) TaxID=2545762 RepID=UPI001552DF88|nr:PAS domain S-box protein [Caulobacter sp. RHG1]NQE61951.1 Sensory box histidine kinase/response regulator [Caulobacter sp. RHG1]
MPTAPALDQPLGSARPKFLNGGGACADLVAAKDWSTTPLGPIEDWAPCLTNAVSILLRSRVPIVMLWGVEGVMLYNDAYSGFAGGRHPELLGSNVREGWREVADFNDNVMRVGLAGGTLHYRDQELTLHRNGAPEPVWMDLDYSPVLDEAGEPAGVICFLAETTERVAAERRKTFLHTLSEDLQGLRTPADIMSLTADRLGERLDASRVFYAEIASGRMTVDRDFARGVGSIVGEHSLEAFGPDLLAAYKVGTPVVMRDVSGDDRLGPEARAGLTSRQVGAFVDVVLFEEAQWVGLLAVQNATPRVWTQDEEALVQEVGERVKVAVERARAERDRLWDLSQDMLARADYSGMMSAVSPAWTQVLGWSENELLTRGYATFMHPEDMPPTLEAIARMAETRQPTRFENRIATKDGDWKHIEWTVAPEPDGVNFVAVGRDLSGAKAREAELDAAREALRQSQKMEAVGQLTGGIAHDFNNMLTGVIGSLDLIKRNLASGKMDRVERYMDAACSSAQRAAALTSRLLAFGRRQSLDLKATDLNALVGGMEELLHRTLGEQIALETHLAADLWAASTDTNQFESALLNLCINARDAMPHGGKLVVETSNTELDERYTREYPELESGDYVVLSVTDTGAGMSASTIEKVFEPFFTTKPVGQGTGLGLSMIYGFARQSGGHVRIYSELGQGTTVKLFVPRSHGEMDARTEPMAAAPRGSGETVMVVEDDPSVRLIVTEVLEELGYGAIEAVDANRAIPVLQSGQRIDLLVTDVGLPGLNGRQLAEIARQSRPELKVLFITGYAQNAAVRAGFLDEGMDMMTKPFAVEALATRLRDILGG